MSKRFLSILLLSALIMGIFSGCGHTHAFGDWEEVTPATYSKKGLQVRSCSCGEKEEAPIEKLKSETTTLKTAELVKELQAIYDESIKQKSIHMDDNRRIYACYDDGSDIYLYYYSDIAGTETEEWYGKQGNARLHFSAITSFEGEQRAVETITAREIEKLAEQMKIDAYAYLADLITMIEKADSCAGKKTTGDRTVYTIKAVTDDDDENITISVLDGRITTYDHYGYITAYFAYGSTIRMPDKDTFTQAPQSPVDPEKPDEPQKPSEPEKPKEPYEPGTEPEVVDTNTVTVKTSGSLKVALTTGEDGKFKSVSQLAAGVTDNRKKNLCWGNHVDFSHSSYGLSIMCWYPAAVNYDDSNAISKESVLVVPVYGADGRVQALEPLTRNGTYSNKAFVVNHAYGVRGVGVPTDEGIFKDPYGCIVDLAFQTPQENPTLHLATGDAEGSTVRILYIPETFHVSEIMGFAGAIRIVFFDTESQAVLAHAALDCSDAEIGEEEIVFSLAPIDGDDRFITDTAITELTANETQRVSALMYIDGNYVDNASVGWSINAIQFHFAFTAQ